MEPISMQDFIDTIKIIIVNNFYFVHINLLDFVHKYRSLTSNG